VRKLERVRGVVELLSIEDSEELLALVIYARRSDKRALESVLGEFADVGAMARVATLRALTREAAKRDLGQPLTAGSHRRRMRYQIRGTRRNGPGGAGPESLCTETTSHSEPKRRWISSLEAPLGPIQRGPCANAISNRVAPGAASELTPRT
jgi:hypothetical protein